MATPTWVTLANANEANQTSTGAAYSNSTTLSDISPGGTASAMSLAAGQLYPGQMFRFFAGGIYSTAGSAPNLTLGVYLGGVSAGAGAQVLGVTNLATTASQTNQLWSLKGRMRVITTGLAGVATVVAMGELLGFNATPISGAQVIPNTSASGGTVTGTIQTQTAQILTLGAQWSALSASNSITCYFWTVEYLTEP